MEPFIKDSLERTLSYYGVPKSHLDLAIIAVSALVRGSTPDTESDFYHNELNDEGETFHDGWSALHKKLMKDWSDK